jgi:hypothetical protein
MVSGASEALYEQDLRRPPQASGLGWGIAVMPSVGVIVAMLALTLLVATVAALLLARRSARPPSP